MTGECLDRGGHGKGKKVWKKVQEEGEQSKREEEVHVKEYSSDINLQLGWKRERKQILHFY